MMDLRTGKLYASKEEAMADGVPEGDVVVIDEELTKMLDGIPAVSFGDLKAQIGTKFDRPKTAA